MSETKSESTAIPPLTWGKPSQIWRQLGIALLVLICWGLLLATVSVPSENVATPGRTGEALSWERDVYPILQKQCAICHGASGGYSVETLEKALAGGRSGRAIIPGDAQNSLVYRLLEGPVGSIPRMPLGQTPLPPEVIELLGEWINQLPAAR